MTAAGEPRPAPTGPLRRVSRSAARRSTSALVALGCLAVACRSDPAAPLGSFDNPVRADAFHGELEYLGRLRCRDGSTPLAQGLPTRHARSPRLITVFRVRCIYLNEELEVYFDAHHPGYVETRPLPGFALSEGGAPRLPERRH